MRYKQLLVVVVSFFVILLAYLLRDLVYDQIVIPFSYLWWRLGLYYHTIEEETWLVLTVAVISILAYVSVAGEIFPSEASDGDDKFPVQGPVEELMTWLTRSQHRPYYRWQVANRLSRLARTLIRQRDGEGHWNISNWDAPEDVKAYLRYGEKRSSGGRETMFVQGANIRSDRVNPVKVVEYLESKIGERFDATK